MKSGYLRSKVAVIGLGIGLAWICWNYSGNSIARSIESQTSSNAGAIFASECATCHGKDGKGKTFKAKFNHARNLTDAKWQAEVTDERLYNSIHNGKGKMPSFGKKLSDSQINALVTFVRGLK